MTGRLIARAMLAMALATPQAMAQSGPPDAMGAPPGGPGGGGETVDLAIAEGVELDPADETTAAIVEAARAFLDTLDTAEREAVLFAFDDDTQRARWSNLPLSIVPRAGLARGDLDAAQLAALDALLSTVLSADGMRNLRLQLAADDALTDSADGPGPVLRFGSDLYHVSILGEPAVDAPWMLQFGGHHLALNVTVAGPRASFSPMLTGGQPLTVTYEGEEVYITRQEVEAARAFLDALDEDQRAQAIRGDRVAQLLLGPGAYGTVIAPEGISGADLDEGQRALLLDVVAARIGQLNERDAAAKMDAVREGIEETWFGWWGPVEPFGAAYVRISGPEIVMEYAPQGGMGAITEHTHNMYRDPANDYGAAWIGAE